MAGVLCIYGFILAAIINGKMEAATFSAYSGYAHLGARLTLGMGSWRRGWASASWRTPASAPTPSRSGIRATAQHPRLFVGMILIFAEALGVHGLIVGLVLASTAEGKRKRLCSPYS